MYNFKYCSPLGEIMLESDGEVLTGLWFAQSSDSKKHKVGENKNLPIFEQTIMWLDEYFSGKEPKFTPKYCIHNATPFQQEVLEVVSKIPYGKLMTYGDIAKQLASKRRIARMSAQAVGGAVGWNPICIIVPCHRVVGAGKNLIGYGGGIENKVALLKLEGIDTNSYKVPRRK